MPDQPNPQSPLDEALLAAQQEGAHANFFYDSLLNAMLFVPVKKADAEAGDWRQLGMNEPFHPLFLSFPQGKAIPVFDSVARMKEWADQKNLDYVVLKGHQLLQILSNPIGILLNLGTPFHYTLTPETLVLLRQAMKPIQPS